MSVLHLPEYLGEPERYELLSNLPSFDLTRREFFRITGGGVIVALLLGEIGPAAAQRQRPGGNQPKEIGAWLHIGEDSAVTVYTRQVEIGPNIRTSPAPVVAEELHAPVKNHHLRMAD